jgi:hypothetical protein
MHRRQILSAALALPAALALAPRPARATVQGSTLLQAPGYASSGSFTVTAYAPGAPGAMEMVFTDGPRVDARLGAGAIDRMLGAAAGDRVSVLYVGFNGNDSVMSDWTVTQLGVNAARARFDAGGIAAEVSALVGGAQQPGVGLAAMIVAGLSGGAALRQAAAARLQAVISTRPAGGAHDFGLEVTLRPA